MRPLMKFLHTFSSCGVVGALLAYMVVLIYAPHDTPQDYADMRKTVLALCNYILIPSLGISLITGLLAMVVHKPYMDRRWAWAKALLGMSMFESTFAIVGSKADYAAKLSQRIANGEASADILATTLHSEWTSLGAIMALSIANIVLGVWRPKLKRKTVPQPATVRA